MSTWTEAELLALNTMDEIRVAGRRRDSSLRTFTIVWHVVVDGKLYIRSVRGMDGNWYKGVIRHHEGAIRGGGKIWNVTYIPDNSSADLIDAAYFAKYGDGSSTHAITSTAAKATTLRVEPR